MLCVVYWIFILLTSISLQWILYTAATLVIGSLKTRDMYNVQHTLQSVLYLGTLQHISQFTVQFTFYYFLSTIFFFLCTLYSVVYYSNLRPVKRIQVISKSQPLVIRKNSLKHFQTIYFATRTQHHQVCKIKILLQHTKN